MLLNAAAFVVIMAGIMSAKSLIIPFLLAAFLAVICGPPLYWLRTRGVPPLLSIILLVLVLIAVEMVVARLIGSSLADFSRNLPLYQSRLKEILGGGILWLQEHGIEVTDDVLVSQFDPGKIMGLAANTLNRMGALLTNTFMIIVTLVFILLEATGFPDKLRAIAGDRNASLEDYAAITRGVNRYLVIKTCTSLATGILLAVALRFIGVDFAGMWGLVAFIFNFVPTIGSILAAIPAVLVALVQLGPRTGRHDRHLLPGHQPGDQQYPGTQNHGHERRPVTPRHLYFHGVLGLDPGPGGHAAVRAVDHGPENRPPERRKNQVVCPAARLQPRRQG
jgi:AI-2 transport protein TqsA